ncbi:hypothetical protein [Streptomyces chumphonensis]|uniref:hypothetical protein n=1 Tax=Streptomyces chumphonensis TaxID=1214925 RepID=UPI003D733232
MAARKTTARKPKAPPAAPQCNPCRGSGWVTETYRVGRSLRPVGESDVLCARCLGSGIDPTPDRW